MTTAPSLPPVSPSGPGTAPPRYLVRLREQLRGELVLPADRDRDQARAAWHLTLDRRPVAVTVPEGAYDVLAVMRYADHHDLRVAAQSTGHGAVALEQLEGTILVRTHRMNGVTIDAVGHPARVEAGARWQVLVPLGAEHGDKPPPKTRTMSRDMREPCRATS
jgi:FAD/FMN-containing dehydrogenase